MSAHQTACFGKVVWVVLFIAVCGQVISTSHGQDEPLHDTEDTRDQLVLFANGRMLSGQVTRNGGGYLIEQPNGRVQVTAEEVKFIAKDLRDAYRQQRDSIVEPTPATHVALANWCISHRLLEEATEELKKCLKRDPENLEARRLLQRLTDTIRSHLPPKNIEQILAKTPDGFVLPEAESLGGLSKESAAQFTSRIQPLLLNKCGNASCHGSTSSNQFRLSPARTGSNGSRQITERNLAEALKQLDLEEVASSRLLRATKGSHGGKGTIFIGPAGAEQAKQLREWARAVAHEKRSDEKEFDNRNSMTAAKPSKKRMNKVTPASYAVVEAAEASDLELSDTSEKVDFVEEEPPKKSETGRPRRLKADPTDAKALAMEPEDAFNPEEFNRRYRR